ncbi:MAG: hypothetical protein EOM04_09490, partial [Clostridia bacterium]|nr:hypothetical protein [Clostridia bacterium]
MTRNKNIHVLHKDMKEIHNEKGFTSYLSKEKHRELRVLAAERGITMKDILLEGIELYKSMNSRTK